MINLKWMRSTHDVRNMHDSKLSSQKKELKKRRKPPKTHSNLIHYENRISSLFVYLEIEYLKTYAQNASLSVFTLIRLLELFVMKQKSYNNAYGSTVKFVTYVKFLLLI